PWGACYVYLATGRRPGRYEYHETHGVLPCIRLANASGKGIRWAVPIDDHRTRWFSVTFHEFGEDVTHASGQSFSDGHGAAPDGRQAFVRPRPTPERRGGLTPTDDRSHA